jgi:hypothetical protein
MRASIFTTHGTATPSLAASRRSAEVQVANTLAQLIIGGSLASTEIAGETDDKGGRERR